MTTEQSQRYELGFEALEKRLNGEGSSQLHSLRKSAFARFVEMGYPTQENEEWRFTNVQAIASRPFQPALVPSKSSYTPADIDRMTIPAANRLVFVDGQYTPGLSAHRLPREVTASGLAEIRKFDRSIAERWIGTLVKGTESAFTALNTAFLWDGAYLHVPAGIEIDDPIVIVFVSSGTTPDLSIHARNIIRLDEHAAAKVVEFHVGDKEAQSLSNAVTEIHLARRSRLEHEKVQVEPLSAFHVGSTTVNQLGESAYRANCFALGGQFIRNDLTSVLADERCECTFNGLSLANGDQLIDNHTTIDHSKPNCNSWEVYKAILNGNGRGVFNGKIFVRKDAQKTNAKQTNKTLLLSDDATIDSKPQLEIFADDVKCTHGATVGRLDDNMVFYLRSRGIGEEDARDILTFAFADEIVGHVSVAAVREFLESAIHARLDQGRPRKGA